jgi:hypothetical protein
MSCCVCFAVPGHRRPNPTAPRRHVRIRPLGWRDDARTVPCCRSLVACTACLQRWYADRGPVCMVCARVVVPSVCPAKPAATAAVVFGGNDRLDIDVVAVVMLLACVVVVMCVPFYGVATVLSIVLPPYLYGCTIIVGFLALDHRSIPMPHLVVLTCVLPPVLALWVDIPIGLAYFALWGLLQYIINFRMRTEQWQNLPLVITALLQFVVMLFLASTAEEPKSRAVVSSAHDLLLLARVLAGVINLGVVTVLARNLPVYIHLYGLVGVIAFL